MSNWLSSRIAREQRTVSAMIRMYCRARHLKTRDLCCECAGLTDYALKRLHNCPFGNEKNTCAQCPVHCYKPGQRNRIKEIMRYAGPRMLWRHPLLAILHMIDSSRKR